MKEQSRILNFAESIQMGHCLQTDICNLQITPGIWLSMVGLTGYEALITRKEGAVDIQTLLRRLCKNDLPTMSFSRFLMLRALMLSWQDLKPPSCWPQRVTMYYSLALSCILDQCTQLKMWWVSIFSVKLQLALHSLHKAKRGLKSMWSILTTLLPCILMT